MLTRKKAAIVSIDKTKLTAIVLANAGKSEYEHYFSTSELTQTAKYLINEYVVSLGKEQGRTIVADSAQLSDCMNNLTHHFMSFCADSEQHEAVIFDGFNDQHGAAIQITLKLMRTEIMAFDKSPAQ